MTDAPDVRVGQVWADNDKRSDGRHVKVIAIEVTLKQAVVLPCNSVGGVHDTGRRTRIRLTRFRPTSTGYRLVRDVDQDICSCADPVHVLGASPSCVRWSPEPATGVTSPSPSEVGNA